MINRRRWIRETTALAIVLSMVVAPLPRALAAAPAMPVMAAAQAVPAAAQPVPTGAKPAPADAKPAAVAAQPPATAPAATVDGVWPRAYELRGGGQVLMYQPQIASWSGQKKLVAYSAVSYRAPDAQKPALGTVKIEADTKVAVTERLVNFENMHIVEASFQTLPKEQTREIVGTIEQTIPKDDRVIALDRVLANLDKSQIVPKTVEGIKADPPTIFFSKTPAVIVNLDGEPIWSPIRDNDLKFAVNTNWDLFQHVPTKTMYLRNDKSWLKAADVKGPWSPAGTLPASFKKLPADDNWKDVKATLPGAPLAATAAPTVFVSFTPAELILTAGEPKYSSVQGTGLLWVGNTESDVFRLGKAGPLYYLVAGRWFSAPDFTGPWTFATPSLPEDFKKIPLEHERSRVLASVPGTDQAVEAVMIAQIPQTARVKKKELKAPELAYQGEPQFAAIEKTTVERAVNTDKDVFKVGGRYYMCHQGVWFTGPSASGPWEVADSVPQEIYSIPASSPSHHVTYVTVEDDDDDEWVTFAAAAGYTGMMMAWGCMVWGSGYYYPPYWGFYGGGYPYYYGHFPTYGYSAWYNPWNGAYGRSAGVYGPYGGAGVGARYNPRTGTYAATRQGSNVYGSWGSTAVQRGDDWAKTNRYTNRQTGKTTRTIRTDEGAAVTRRGAGGGAVGVGDGGNVYAGRDGNVYRREDGGGWQKYNNGDWSNVDRPSQLPARSGERATPTTQSVGDRSTSPRTGADGSTVDQLNRDSAARREGTQRTGDYGNYRSGSGTTRDTGSYRSGSGSSGRSTSGASRGGGGARAGGGGRGGGGRRR